MLRLVLVASLLVAAYGGRLSFELGKIVGGQNAEIRDMPYQAGITFDNVFICGGSILSNKVVVTAAHCASKPARNYRVFVGINELKRVGTEGQIVGVSDVEIHPNFNRHTLDYDAALFFLATPLNFGPTVGPISLPTQDQTISDRTPALISGWGRLQEGGPASNLLQKATVFIVNQERCNEMHLGQITSSMLCAGLVGVGGTSICQGDSGGPLVANGVLMGISSATAAVCGHPYKPGVYVRVPAISNWIEERLAQ